MASKKNERGIYCSPASKRIEKAFVIRDYYTILENDTRSDRIEREFYGRIDDFLGQLLPEVIGVLNSGRIPSFTPEALNSLRTVAMEMAKRTPDFLKDHDDIKLGREFFGSCLNALPDGAPKSQREMLESKLANDVTLRDKGRHIRVTATLGNSQ